MPWLRAVLVAMALFIAAAGGAFAHSPGVADEDQAAAHEVEAFREFIKRAVERRDEKALRALYADNFTHTHPSGKVERKAARIAAILAGGATLEGVSASDIHFRVFGEHTIVVTGISVLTTRARRSGERVRWMVVYAKVGGDWKIAASQATRLR